MRNEFPWTILGSLVLVFGSSNCSPTTSQFEVFNLFNRQNVNGIDTVYGAADFSGGAPHRYGDGVSSAANPTFGSPYLALAREVQFASV